LGCKPTEFSTDTDSETALLVANIESALRSLENMYLAESDGRGSLGTLELALSTYGSVKHLLPKLNLSAAQRATVEWHLQRLRGEIAHSVDDGVGTRRR